MPSRRKHRAGHLDPVLHDERLDLANWHENPPLRIISTLVISCCDMVVCEQFCFPLIVKRDLSLIGYENAYNESGRA